MTRTEHDTWDTASGVGATATGSAAVRALASRQPEPLIDDPFAAPLVRRAGVQSFVNLVDGQAEPAAVFGELAPRIIAGMAIRTRYHDDVLLEHTGRGIRQVVMLASGLDTRAYRLQWPTGTVVFDVDQESMTDFKTATLAELDVAPSCDHRVVGADLRYDWADRLTDAGFNRTQRTVWLVEGLLPYLPPQAQDALLESITALSAPGSALIVESVDSPTGHHELRADLENVFAEQRRHGHDFDVDALMYDGERHETGHYLRGLGWATTLVDSADMYEAYGRVAAPGRRPFPEVRTVLATVD